MTAPGTKRRLDPTPPGVTYPLVLTGPDQSPFRALVGVMVGIVAFMLLVPAISSLVLRVTWLFRGRPPFEEYSAEALAYQLPDGVAASQLALAFLIVIALWIVRALHNRNPIWLLSVQPGSRWRYLLICLVIALVVLNGVLWLSFPVLGMPPFQAVQSGWPGFVVAVVLFSPLQAAAEEIFFRGYILQALGSAFNQAWVGIIGSALLFALFHGAQNPALFFHRFAFGVVAGWLVLATGGLEAGIGAHIINNLFAYGYGMFTGGIALTKATTQITWGKAAFDTLSFVLFALVAWWVGRRLNVATRTPGTAQAGARPGL